MGDSTTSDGVLLKFDEVGGPRSVVLEDDGRVAYAYLLVNNRMSSDVWLYNRLPAPESVDWRDRTAAPFLNPAKFCGTPALPRLRNDAAVRCAWTDTGVELFVDGLHWANLEAGISPGWSRGAGQPGPLAKPLRRA